MSGRPTPLVRIAVLAATGVLVFVLGACGSSGSSATASDTGKSTTTSRPKTPTATQLRGKRYCEVLLLHPAPAGITADVYNTFPINDCPEAQWKAMDPRTIAQENSMLAALLNGPRYWLMDAIEKNDTGAPVQKSFGGMEMIQRATVVVGNPVEASKPYVENAVDRRTVFSYDKGRTVYELTTPDGTKYVMQSWSQQVDPTLEESDLASLGARLQPQAGWSYAARTLTAPLRVVTTSTTARVVQDELKNSYSMETS